MTAGARVKGEGCTGLGAEAHFLQAEPLAGLTQLMVSLLLPMGNTVTLPLGHKTGGDTMEKREQKQQYWRLGSFLKEIRLYFTHH